MSNDLFARAKGPRRCAGEWNAYATLDGLACPWCGCDCDAAPRNWVTSADDRHENAVTTCPDCGKEFMCPDERGELVCVGLLSPADMKYEAWRATHQRGEGGSGE